MTESNGTTSIPWRIAIIDMLIISSLWCLSLFIVNPLGNFPLNDDWSFGLMVKQFMENGDFRVSGWTYMTLLTNVIWGSLFCLPAGFSFTFLRISTLVLALFGILGVYLMVRDMRQPRWLAVMASLILGFNPIYYALSNTFMTDVPATAIMILAAVFFARNLTTGSNLNLFIGTMLAIAAVFSRQLAFCVPLAFSIALIIKHGFTKRNILRAAIPVVLCLGLLIVFHHWLAVSGRLPEVYYKNAEILFYAFHNPEVILWWLIYNSFVSLVYLGLFLLPFLIFAAVDVLKARRTLMIAVIIFSIGITALLYNINFLMPMSDNILIKSGIGPITLRDNFYLHINNVPELPVIFWFAITAMGLLGAVFLITILVARIIDLWRRRRLGGKLSKNEYVGIFFLLSAIIYLGPIFLIAPYDRYLLQMIPVFTLGIIGISGQFPEFSLINMTKGLRFAVVALLVAGALLSVAGTRDYLAWNRLRWTALNDLMKNSHVHADEIDGGFEFNGLYMYDPYYKKVPEKSNWWVQGDTYQIGMGSVPGYKIIKEYSYSHWLPPHAGKVVVLQKNLQSSKDGK